LGQSGSKRACGCLEGGVRGAGGDCSFLLSNSLQPNDTVKVRYPLPRCWGRIYLGCVESGAQLRRIYWLQDGHPGYCLPKESALITSLKEAFAPTMHDMVVGSLLSNSSYHGSQHID
jgi:hypothetical protein